MKGKDTYDTIKTYKDDIELANIIQSIFHLQYGNKQYLVSVVLTDNKVYLF